jgi:hypothetical protein
MGIVFYNYRGPSTRTSVVRILSIIEQDPISFIYISRVFNAKRRIKNNQDRNEWLTEVDEQIELIINSPANRIESAKKQSLIDLIKEIYREPDFEDIRTEVLESVVYKYGPFTTGLTRKDSYVEPVIKDGTELIGNACKIDSVFYTSDIIPLEFVECKANIASVIPSTLPLEKISESHRKKVEYLQKAHAYLSEKFTMPQIYVACYNSEFDAQLSNVHNNWGFKFFNFLSPEDLLERIKGK